MPTFKVTITNQETNQVQIQYVQAGSEYAVRNQYGTILDGGSWYVSNVEKRIK